MNILLIEDDLKIALFVLKGLREAGYQVDHAADGSEGLRLALAGEYALLIVDIMIPEIDGFEVLRSLRRQGLTTPVIILSARDSIDDRVLGLKTGADDYLVKPFSFAELLARVEARIRSHEQYTAPVELRVADLRVDLLRSKVYRGRSEIELQPLEYILLVYLMRQTGRVVSKETILQQVWEYNAGSYTNVVETRICKLRDKVDKGYEPKLIHTVRGAGYALKAAG